MKNKKLWMTFLIFILFFFVAKTPVFAITQPVINEFLAHASSGNKEWVEFYNPDHIDLSSYWLDDDTDFVSDARSSSKKSLISIDKTDALYQYLEFDSFLNNSGDYVVLFSSDGKILDQYQYAKDPGIDVSIGRSPDGSDNWVVFTSSSKGSTNSLVRPTSLPTPSPTPLPTKTPTATPTTKPTPTQKPAPTPTKTPTPTKSPTPIPKPTSVSVTPERTEPTDDIGPTSVLGESTESGIKNEDQSPKTTPIKEKKVSGIQTTNLSKILISIGVILLITCGILFFRSYIKNKKDRVEDE